MATDDELDRDELDRILGEIEQTHSAILSALGCPTDPVGVYDLLKAVGDGEKLAPWPEETADRDRRRAILAMHALVRVRNIRSYLADENARMAAYHALFAGDYAGDIVLLQDEAARGAKDRADRQKGGQKRGQQLTQVATRDIGEGVMTFVVLCRAECGARNDP